jgi:hypothetical protein
MGVDPGLTRCGLSVVEGGQGRKVIALDVDVVRTPSDDPLPRRLLTISDTVEHWMDTHRPDVVAIERVFAQQNVSTVMGTAQAGGVIARAAKRASTCTLPSEAGRPSPVSNADKLRSPRWSPESLRCRRTRRLPTPPTHWRWRYVTAGARP